MEKSDFYLNNFAYNFEVFEDKQSRKSNNIIKIPDRNQRLKIQEHSRQMFLVRLVFSVFLVFILVGSLVFGQAVVAEYTNRILVCKKDLDAIRSQNDQLEMRLISCSFCTKNYNHGEDVLMRPVEHVVINVVT